MSTSSNTNGGHYLIFVPNIASPTATQLADRAIADLMDGLHAYPIERGIGCDPGCCYVVQSLDARQPVEPPEVSAVRTHWVPSERLFDGQPMAWFGFDDDTRPTPIDLQRSVLHDSTTVELCDGNGWKIPILDRLPDQETSLALSMLCEEMRGALALPDYKPVLKGHVYITGSRTLVCCALRCNYRLPVELAESPRLRLLDLNTLMLATVAACGIKREIQQIEFARNTSINQN